MKRIIILCAFAATSALADPWDGIDSTVREWFRQLMQPDNPGVSCCGLADAYEADDFAVDGDHYVAIITGHRAATAIPLGTRIPVPNPKMKFDAGNPNGHGIIFIGAPSPGEDGRMRAYGQVFCYFAPGGG
jgi:hypothetical protein